MAIFADFQYFIHADIVGRVGQKSSKNMHKIVRFLKSLFSSQLGIIHILRLHIFGTFLALPTRYVGRNTVQAFLKFRGFDSLNFRFTGFIILSYFPPL